MATTTSTLEIILQIKNQTTAGVDKVVTQLKSVQASLKPIAQDAQAATKGMTQFGRAMASTNSELGGLVSGLKGLAATLGGLILINQLKSLADVAARAQVLGTVLGEVGRASGLTRKEVADLDASVQKMGITASASRESLTKMLQAGLDTSKAAELARAAQNFAVISGEDSSTTFSRLITNIQQLDVVGLRFQGVVVSMEQVMIAYAKTLGKTAGELSQAEKQQALMNEVLKKGAASGQIYLAAMGDVGKAVASLKRLETDYAKTLGDITLPAYKALVDEFGVFLKQANLAAQTYDVTGEGAKAFGEAVRTVASALRVLTLALIDNAKIVVPLVTAISGFLAFRAVAVALGYFTNLLKINTTVLTIASTATKAYLANLLALGLGYVKFALLLGTSLTALAAAPAAVIAAAAGMVGVAAALGVAIGLFLNRFDVVRKAAAVTVASIALGWAYLQGVFAKDGNTKNIKIAKDLLASATDNIDADTAATEKNATAKAKLVAVTDQQIALQTELIDAENELVAAGKANDEARYNSALIAFEKLKALNKKLDTERLDQIKKIKDANRPVDTPESLEREKKEAQIIKNAKAYDDLSKAVQEAKTNLDTYITTVETGDAQAGRASKSQIVVSAAFRSIAGSVGKVVDGFGSVDEKGNNALSTVKDVRLAIEKLADGAKSADEVAFAIKRIQDTAVATGVAVDDLLRNLRERQQNFGLKAITEDISGVAATVEKAKGIISTLQSVFSTQVNAANSLKTALAEMGVRSVSSLRAIEGVGRDAFGNLTFAANLFKNQSAEAGRALLDTANQAATEAANALQVELSSIATLASAKNTANAAKIQSESAAKATTIAIAKETAEAQIVATKKYFEALVSLREQALVKIKEYYQKIKGFDEELLNNAKSKEQALRDFRQQGQSEEQNRRENLQRIQELAFQSQAARENNQFELARELTAERITLVKALSTAEAASDPTQKLQVQNQITAAYAEQEEILNSQRAIEQKNLKNQVAAFQTLDEQIDKTAQKIKEISEAQLIELKVGLKAGEVENVITAIQNALNSRSFTIAVEPIGGSISGIRRAGGGDVTGPGTGTSDSIPAWLSAGEFVNRAKSVAYYGSSFFRGLNNMTIPRSSLRLAMGGMVPGPRAVRLAGGGPVLLPSGASSSRDTVNLNIAIGNEKVSLFAERQQANKFVKAFKRMEVGS